MDTNLAFLGIYILAGWALDNIDLARGFAIRLCHGAFCVTRENAFARDHDIAIYSTYGSCSGEFQCAAGDKRLDQPAVDALVGPEESTNPDDELDLCHFVGSHLL